MDVTVRYFDDWRAEARRLLSAGAEPDAVRWHDAWSSQSLLPLDGSETTSLAAPIAFRVPQQFLRLARLVACHRHPRRWEVLYRVLWRVTHGEPELLEVAIDDDVYALRGWEKSVRRDEHKMHAFVRFQRLADSADERYVAWYQPDHHILRLGAEFFVERFAAMRWTIMTPEETALWEPGGELTFGPGVPRSSAPRDDELVDLWRAYYASTFNPARLNVPLMRREMPQRFWPALPESAMIAELVQQAPRRTAGMLEQAMAKTNVSAADFLPPKHDLKSLAAAAAHCRGCDLFMNATQTVFGQGGAHAQVVFVGEQPGDSEDLAGEPFVGPAGKLLDSVLDEVGIDRKHVYVTNAVKHFKWTPRGKRRMHAKPNAREMSACRPWLEAELEAIEPKMLVCLGATAAQSLLGRTFKLTERRGQPFVSDWADWTMATYHPSAVLRSKQTPGGDEIYEAFRADLRVVAKAIKKLQ